MADGKNGKRIWFSIAVYITEGVVDAPGGGGVASSPFLCGSEQIQVGRLRKSP